MTSTPSATAWSMAATESEFAQPAGATSDSQQTLYIATYARGAMPEITSTPRSLPSMLGSTPKLPAAVEAVWLPCPSSSRGDRKPVGSTRSRPKPSTK